MFCLALFILPFLFFAILFFLILWLSDIYLTKKSIEKLGSHIEVNPIMHFIFGLRSHYLWLFKAVELLAFVALVYLISVYSANEAVNVMLVLLFVYTLIVAQGISIYISAVGNPLPIAVIFVALALVGLAFVFLNYQTFLNSVAISNALSQCGVKYSELYSMCSKTAVANASNFTSRFGDLGLNISR